MTRFLSGYVEGYYGRLLTFAERAGVVRKLRAVRATHYLYAPKEDPFHRRDWRNPWPASWRADFRKFVVDSGRGGIRVIPGLAPGLSYRYRSREDYGALARKFESLAALGCGELALLMDDIPAALPRADAGAFQSLGEAHGILLEELDRHFSRRGVRLWFCPTVYCDAFARDGKASGDPYLRDLARTLPPEVGVMWTGPKIISPRLAPADLRDVQRILGRPVILWDNLYANDYCPGKIFLGPFRGRPRSLLKSAAGLMLNPTGLYHTDLFLLDLLGGFLAGDSPESAWKTALRDHGVPSSFLKIAHLLASPFDSSVPASGMVDALRKALKPLIWDWKSPVKREWYPYLYSLDADLRLLSPKDRPDAAWVRKKYSPVVALRLLKQKS